MPGASGMQSNILRQKLLMRCSAASVLTFFLRTTLDFMRRNLCCLKVSIKYGCLRMRMEILTVDLFQKFVVF